MAKVYSLQTNFTCGAIAKSVQGRTDLAKYGNAVDELINYVITKRGGIFPRAGTVSVQDIKTQESGVILIPFIFNTNTAYMIEAGDSYFRFYKDGAYTGKEIATSYTIDDLANIRYVQSYNRLIITNPDHKVSQLTLIDKFTHTFVFSEITFNYPAMNEQGVKPLTTLALSAQTGTITLTAGLQTFMASDVGRQVSAGSGLCKITTYTSSTVVTADVLIDFDTDSYASGEWDLLNSPLTTIKSPSHKSAGDETELKLSDNGWRDNTWSFDNTGDYIKMDDGLAVITSITSAKKANAKILKTFTLDDNPLSDSPNPAYAGEWSIITTEWTDDLGYPAVCGLYEGRLILGGSDKYPNRVWGSRSGNIFDFLIGVEQADPFEFDVASDRFDRISGINALRNLIIRTDGSEYAINGTNDGPIAPIDTSVKRQSSYGSSNIRSTSLEAGFAYVQRAGNAVFFYNYDYNLNGFDGDDLTDLNPEITANGITSISFEQDPYQHLYCVTEEEGLGIIGILCIDRKQEVVGWSKLVPAPNVSFFYVATMPVGGKDQTWAIASINGRIQVVYFDYDISFDGYTKVIAPSPTTTFTGFSLLKNTTVTILLDGNVYKDIQVDGSGHITTPTEGTVLETGYFFESECKLLPVELMLEGSIQGRMASVNKALIKVLNTQTLDVLNSNGDDQPVEFRDFGDDVLDNPIPEFTGIKEVTTLGVGPSKTTLTIKRTSPLKQHIISINRMVTVND